MMRTILAVLVGAIVGVLTIMFMEFLFSLVLPPSIEPSDAATYMQNVPLVNKLSVLAGWAVASLAGGHVATRIAGSHDARPALVVGGLLFLAGVFDMTVLPHPLWMWAASPVALVAPAWLAARRFAPESEDLRSGASTE